MLEQLLKDVLSHLHNIQSSRKGSIGSLNNVYLPQLRVNHINQLTARVKQELEQLEYQNQKKTKPL